MTPATNSSHPETRPTTTRTRKTSRRGLLVAVALGAACVMIACGSPAEVSQTNTAAPVAVAAKADRRESPDAADRDRQRATPGCAAATCARTTHHAAPGRDEHRSQNARRQNAAARGLQGQGRRASICGRRGAARAASRFRISSPSAMSLRSAASKSSG